VVGATLTYFAGRATAHVEVLETIGAAMLIAGLALAGSALPVIPRKIAATSSGARVQRVSIGLRQAHGSPFSPISKNENAA
jgi:hypothetical protein